MSAIYLRREKRNKLREFINNRVQEIEEMIKVNTIMIENDSDKKRFLMRENSELYKILNTNKEIIKEIG